ncbi:transcriptional regulator [Rickettsia bellii]|uniref:Putative transcriptional regulator n=3 Tax=Rickettsia bellii TaxID=33990 RepID=Q1RJY1_RICBR|nr:transcriptional regulator [Rickettsia bellii]ABE04333.1 Putative transcriptional regulator [Rickettsia bellii RML369-C]ABV79666.1 Putative transcriptional regulator [Rickettsia bellii OSU 85-389]ARD86136.1 transcriptional regulator [Rickettsia bellii]KJV90371.1 putative transcriptional regulator [Rickettsia bellii str. RML An4]KJV92325.1 putative transcriptional regulator [Rickettsia bellii str. RML Mogi]
MELHIIKTEEEYNEVLREIENQLETFTEPRSRVSEILNKKRTLTLPMIRKLHKELHIPADILIQECEKKRA